MAYTIDNGTLSTGYKVCPSTAGSGNGEAIEKEKEDGWEQEADDLYQWTQELSFEDIT